LWSSLGTNYAKTNVAEAAVFGAAAFAVRATQIVLAEEPAAGTPRMAIAG
jgi:hypothetical protein